MTNRRIIRTYRLLHSRLPLRHWMYRPGVKYKNILFEFNAYDDDDHPSVPHGDSIKPYHLYHLDLRNGAVWKKREKIIGYLSRKEFEKLKQSSQMRELIINAQAYYREHHQDASQA